jgi:hypothetical protein
VAEKLSSKFQAPTSREAPSFNVQTWRRARFLEFDVCSFSGAWMLELGALFSGTLLH